MALKLPATAKEISQKAKVDVKREIGQSDPFVARSYLGAIISSISNRVFEFYAAIRESELESNPATAVINLTRWAATWRIVRLQGTVATGHIWVDSSQTGAGTNIPVGTAMTSSNGIAYTTQGAQDLAAGIISEASQIQHTGGVATFTTGSDHGLASNALVTFSGANQAGYNLVDAPITVTGARTFTYDVAAATVSPSTGSPLASYSGALIAVSAVDSGVEGNLLADATINFTDVIDDVEAGGQVTFPGVTNGSSLESDDSLRKRMLARIQNPITPFNVSNIVAVAREEPGVTRVFVSESTPALGQVTVYFMRDEDDDPIPSTAQVAATKARLVAIKPADIASSDVIVLPPVALTTNLTFTAMTPDSIALREAVTAALANYFKESPEVGVSVVEDAYRSVIFNVEDPVSGRRVSAFTLSQPTALINAQGEADYDNSPATEGSFVGGTGHANGDVLTMSDGTVVTVDLVAGGVVTEFTLNTAASRDVTATVSQVSSDAAGIGFALLPDSGNVVLMTDLTTNAGEIRTLGTVTYSL